jgi:hypothetical protein
VIMKSNAVEHVSSKLSLSSHVGLMRFVELVHWLLCQLVVCLSCILSMMSVMLSYCVFDIF